MLPWLIISFIAGGVFAIAAFLFIAWLYGGSS